MRNLSQYNVVHCIDSVHEIKYPSLESLRLPSVIGFESLDRSVHFLHIIKLTERTTENLGAMIEDMPFEERWVYHSLELTAAHCPLLLQMLGRWHSSKSFHTHENFLGIYAK